MEEMKAYMISLWTMEMDDLANEITKLKGMLKSAEDVKKQREKFGEKTTKAKETKEAKARAKNKDENKNENKDENKVVTKTISQPKSESTTPEKKTSVNDNFFKNQAPITDGNGVPVGGPLFPL